MLNSILNAMNLELLVKVTTIISSATTPILLVVAIMQLHTMLRNRHTDLTVKVFEWFRDPTVVSYHDWLGSVDPNASDSIDYYSDDGRKLRKIAAIFEEVGTLVRMGAIQKELTLIMISGITISTWKRVEKFVEKQRQAHDDPRLWEQFEFLKSESLVYENTHHRGGQAK